LKITQYSLLSTLLHLGPVRASDLAMAMQLTPSALTRNLQALQAQGWIETTHNEVDGRSHLLALTPQGVAVRNAAVNAWKQAQVALNRSMGAARVALLHELLEEVVAQLGVRPEAEDLAESA
jgi:DNA-binding MarR family transcriptional regulator